MAGGPEAIPEVDEKTGQIAGIETTQFSEHCAPDQEGTRQIARLATVLETQSRQRFRSNPGIDKWFNQADYGVNPARGGGCQGDCQAVGRPEIIAV